MQSNRRMRLQSVIQEELSLLISRELKDPRIPPLTVTAVEVTPDASQATIFVALLGGGLGKDGENPPSPAAEKAAQHKIKECLEGLSSATGLLRRHLAQALTIRHVPQLSFREDRGFENAIRVQELLKKISETP